MITRLQTWSGMVRCYPVWSNAVISHTQCCPGSLTEFPEARHSRGEVGQLPHPRDTTHPTSADAGFSADVNMQSDSVQNRLLQCSAEWLSGRDDPRAAASAE